MKATKYYAVWAEDRGALIANLRHIIAQMPEPKSDETPIIEGIMPCGETFEIKTFADVPLESWPCTCGNPRHWFVKYGGREWRMVLASAKVRLNRWLGRWN